MLREFTAVMGSHSMRIEFDQCATGPPRVRLAVVDEAPEGLDGVLGLAYRSREGVQPRLEVFHGPLVRYLGEPNNSGAIGRALARVAAHEAAHFLFQGGHHCRLGLMRTVIPAYELGATDRTPFLQTRSCQTDDSDSHPPTLLAGTRMQPSRWFAAQGPLAPCCGSFIK